MKIWCHPALDDIDVGSVAMKGDVTQPQAPYKADMTWHEYYSPNNCLLADGQDSCEAIATNPQRPHRLKGPRIGLILFNHLQLY